MAVDDQPQNVPGDGKISSKTSSVTDTHFTSQASLFEDQSPLDSPIVGASPPRSGLASGQDPSLLIQKPGAQSPIPDEAWTSSDEKEGAGRCDEEGEGEDGFNNGDRREKTQSRDLARTETNVSIAETLSLPREILFVTIICFGQLFTQSGLGQVVSINQSIGESFGITNPGELSWFVAGYSLTIGTFILFSGRLGDLFGHKTMFLIGMCWYSLWSTICGLAIYSNHVLFIFARVLQGIGPAIVLPNGLAILGVTYAPGRRKEMVFALFGATAPSGSVLGSTFAALFNLTWWPWAFWAFGIVLAGTVVVGYYAIPAASNRHHHEKPQGLKEWIQALDIVGTTLGVGGLVLVNFAWNQAPIVGWPEPYVYVTLIIGSLLLAAFFVFELNYAQQPLIPFHALSYEVSFVLGAVACGWACFGIWFYYTWQFQLVLKHAPPLLATARISPVAVSGLFAALFTGYMLHHLKPPIIMTMALSFFTIGMILLATCPVDQVYWGQYFVSTIVMPWGMDMSFPAATLILSNAVHRKHQGIGASLVNTVVNYSISLGLGFAGTVETQVNKGGTTQEDILKGYRGAYYMGIGLAGLGVAVCLAFVAKSRKHKRINTEEEG
ncbi:MFS general substrate transporter [Hypoxylon trugodes]|uniref:MFS general substrate transporter n=1 Tax=Hypoxylon trugodes TaxID=326681 RepID=UPI0021A12632|nr:MFS general substrate transporter [Hypoxylon trugodes]KAI1393135.1 MFS general substrate transporter [Hypoxylon trugodes]